MFHSLYGVPGNTTDETAFILKHTGQYVSRVKLVLLVFHRRQIRRRTTKPAHEILVLIISTFFCMFKANNRLSCFTPSPFLYDPVTFVCLCSGCILINVFGTIRAAQNTDAFIFYRFSLLDKDFDWSNDILLLNVYT